MLEDHIKEDDQQGCEYARHEEYHSIVELAVAQFVDHEVVLELCEPGNHCPCDELEHGHLLNDRSFKSLSKCVHALGEVVPGLAPRHVASQGAVSTFEGG